jgi:hypothetical protein
LAGEGKHQTSKALFPFSLEDMSVASCSAGRGVHAYDAKDPDTALARTRTAKRAAKVMELGAMSDPAVESIENQTQYP